MSQGARVQVHLHITGRVQGVCYRATACEQALSLGLRGWVRNCRDGSVEAMAAGSPQNVEAFVAWCGHGPRAARVEQVQVQQVAAAEDLADFAVKY